ncbi:CusA/CzcA family heavy metal efflux RND transporter [Chitinophaga japonensis]|uniref:Cobalt-zinc-cadmium resistance protein CzcA n=1 Tax=Chitinophaga japonensis TaxID=104662 RepID=A0A562T6W1_CHIJA|nr:CusA/CzcA family heavy metal efflux RND transporter [Chitinophaga japonensis]TWI89093.1 cobalt-zinc-cadmium resistance protein CzcA [Chitinophaga japonensis]
MLNHIIRFSIRNKLVVALCMLGLIAYGTYEITRLPIDAVPDITENQVQIITVSPSLGAPDVERLISFPVELVCSNIPGLKKIRSFSRFGLSVVTVVFEDDVDIYWVRQQVAERLQEVQSQVPAGVGIPRLAPVTTGLGEIYQYTVRPAKGYEGKYTPMELRTIQDWIIRRQLLGVKGVADVSSFGGYLKQYEIAVVPEKLSAYGITIGDVFTALESNNQNTGGAYIEKGPVALFIRSEGLVGSPEDIGNIVIKNTAAGSPLLVRDVADVEEGYATRYGAMTYNGEREVAGAVVMMLKGANSNEVIHNIKDRIQQIQQTLPEGVIIDPFLDRTKMVNNAIGTVERNLLEGALIVVFVLVLFLGNLRAGLLVASVIPLSMLVAVILMNIFNVSGNLMSLGALDFGLIVDGTLIIVEGCMYRLHHSSRARLSQAEMDGLVKETSGRMLNAAVFGELIILVVYLPIFALSGIEGKMFKPMAQTVAFALFGAFLLSLTYVPMMSALFLSKKIPQKANWSDRMMDRLGSRYQRVLDKVLYHPRIMILSAFALLLVAVFVLSRLGGEFIPQLEEGDFAVETRVMTGSSLKASVAAVSRGSKILLEKFPEVIKVVGKTGSSEIPTDPMPLEASDMMVILKDKDEWTSAATFNELAEKMGKALEDVPGVTFGFQYPVQMRFNELMTGARQDVVCKIYGEDLDTLAALAGRLGEIVRTIRGASDLYVEHITGMPQIVIRYNRAAIAQYGLNISNINKTVNAAFAGQSSGLVYEGERRFDLVVRVSGARRQDLSDVQQLLIPTPAGPQIPLYQVADVNIEEGPAQIQREDAKRRVIVGFNVRGRDVQSIVQELRQKQQQRIKLPPGYQVAYGGAFENLEAARQRLGIAVPVALLLILLMLYFAFHSVKQGLLIYSAIPLSAIGGIFALALRGMPFSISAGVGFIALFGVAVLNGIVLIAEFNRLKAAGQADVRQIILEGTKVRLRPVLMTASVASLGFLPMALSQGAGAEVQRPLATVVIGGLLVATFLTLFILPALYLIFEKSGHRRPPKAAAVTALLVILFLLPLSNVNAQTPISLQAAIDTALRHNLSLQNDKLYAAYLQKLKGSGWNVGQTMITGDYGQINSAYNDTKFSFAQSMQFPTIYARQQALLAEEWKGGQLNVAVNETALRKQVTTVYYQLLYLRYKKHLLEYTDSLYATFLEKAALRFEKGETNIVEKATAATQRGQAGQQLKQLLQDYDILRSRLKWLLHTDADVEPDSTALKMALPPVADTAALSQHPYLRLLSQQQQISAQQYRVEKARLLPDLFVAYNNTSIRGMGADDRYYSSSDRFQSVQVGVGIPLFFQAQKARINAGRINQALAQQKYEAGLEQMQAEYRQALIQYDKTLQAVHYYESSALQQADTMIRGANEQYLNGEINYLEWVLLTNQAVNIRNEYIDAVHNLNTAIINIQNLTGF